MEPGELMPAAATYVEIADTSVLRVNTDPTEISSTVSEQSSEESIGYVFRGDSVLVFSAVAAGSTAVRLMRWNEDRADGFSVAFQAFEVVVE